MSTMTREIEFEAGGHTYEIEATVIDTELGPEIDIVSVGRHDGETFRPLSAEEIAAFSTEHFDAAREAIIAKLQTEDIERHS